MPIEGYLPTVWMTAADAAGLPGQNANGVLIAVVDAAGQPVGTVMLSGPTGTNPSVVATAAAPGSAQVSDWAATTAVLANELRRASAAQGSIQVGALIRSNSARTTRASFDATEAGNWTEIADAMLGANNLSDVANAGTSRTNLGLGGASTLNVGTAAGTVAAGNDSRLTDARTPTAHKASHATGGSDVLSRADIGLGNVDNTSDAGKPVSTAAQTALDAKQATLVSGTTIRTVNGSSLLGAGDVAVTPDLPGGTVQTVTDEGLNSGTANVDRTTVPGQTILRYATTGTTSFTPPLTLPLSQVRVLVVGSGGGGGTGRYRGDTSGRPGGGGGAGGVVHNTAFTVTGPITVSLGLAGAGATDANDTDAGVAGITGGNAVFGSITGHGGGGGGGHDNDGDPWPHGPFQGGSGGGSTNGSAGATKSAAATSAGNLGGTGGTGTFATNDAVGGGGGGAGGNGAANAGGAGVINDITGANVTYAAGGAGSPNSTGGNVGAAGAALTGNGGGGGFAGGSDGLAAGSAPGGAGGTGVIIVRFPTQTRSYIGLLAFANDAAAATGGVLVGEYYRDSVSGAVRQRVA